MKREVPFTFISDSIALNQFAHQHSRIKELAIDTEFMGEKRYKPLICLIQVSSELGNFIIDTLAINDLNPFLRIISDPGITKITHAGENDYRGFFQNYGILPKNIFDTQIAYAFLDYKYPISFKKLVEAECSYRLDKSLTVTQWDQRPLRKDQLQYALDDVLPLPSLKEKLTANLTLKGRLPWAEEEFSLLEQESLYFKGVESDILSQPLIHTFNASEKLFFLRLMLWRDHLAKEKNINRDMVIPSKFIQQLVKGARHGQSFFKDNRRFSLNLSSSYWKQIAIMVSEPVQDWEQKLLASVTRENDLVEDAFEEAITDLVYSSIKYFCIARDLSVSIAFPKSRLRHIHQHPEEVGTVIKGWRASFFGEEIANLLSRMKALEVVYGDKKIIIQ